MVWKTLSGSEQAQIWARYRHGELCSAIGKVLGRPGKSISRFVRQHGGIAPIPRKRSARVLSLAEREEISRDLRARCSLRQIAVKLGRAPSSISREVRRHGGRSLYRALQADARAWTRAARPKPCRLLQQARLGAVVSGKLRENWSPQQISGWLPKAFASDHSMRVSHETIYRTLFIQSRGALNKELQRHLRTRRGARRKKSANTGAGHVPIIDAISIRERPAEVEDRAVPGHWEGDLLLGSRNTCIATLVERHSRFVMLVKLAGRDSETVVEALRRKILRLPQQLRRSLTWDGGSEMARHKEFTVATDVAVYICDPHSPWQRGSNENTNGLLRQYYPKRTDFSQYSQAQLDRVAKELNQRPRMTLNWENPANTLARGVALTA